MLCALFFCFSTAKIVGSPVVDIIANLVQHAKRLGIGDVVYCPCGNAVTW